MASEEEILKRYSLQGFMQRTRGAAGTEARVELEKAVLTTGVGGQNPELR